MKAINDGNRVSPSRILWQGSTDDSDEYDDENIRATRISALSPSTKPKSEPCARHVTFPETRPSLRLSSVFHNSVRGVYTDLYL